MEKLGMVIWLAAGSLVLIATASPEAATDRGEGQVIVTILPPRESEALNIRQQDLQVKVNGKKSHVTGLVPLGGPAGDLELVILIDDSSRDSLSRQFGEIASFIQGLPADAKIALGYMNSGRADLAGPLSTDHTQVASQLRIPNGFNSGPYFPLSDLAKHWPSKDRSAQRQAVLITDGVDALYDAPYGALDQKDPYVEAAINDSVRSGLVVHSICWAGWNRRNRSMDELDGGLMLEVTRTTGGGYCCEGNGEPVSLGPCFREIARRLRNQYRLSFHSGLKGKPEVQRIEIKVGNPTVKVYAPQRVFVTPRNKE